MSLVVGAGLGLALGAGAVLSWAGRPGRRVALLDRVAPYAGLPTAPRPARQVLRTLASAVGERFGSPAATVARLRVLDPVVDLGQFRAEQLLLAAGGGVLGLVGGGWTAWRHGAGSGVLLALLVAGLAGGAALRDQLLTAAVARQRRRLVEEFPTVAELLALSVGAGEDVLAALHRVAGTDGAMGTALRHVVAEVRTGVNVVDALQDMARSSGVSDLERFADAVAVAVVRGSPLAGVLRAQAADARDAGRRRLLEAGGRKEVLMLVPVVFLVLPTTVVFAVFPGVSTLGLAP